MKDVSLFLTKIGIISGFLGAGKTTLIKKLLAEKLVPAEKIVIIENEFGEIGIDGGFLRQPGIEIREINSGCICCTLVGDFGLALNDVLKRYHPERVIIEPSGVGKLSEVLEACRRMTEKGQIRLNMCVTVVDALKYQMYLRNFSEFFVNQLEYATTIILSRTQKADGAKLQAVVNDIRRINRRANLITTPWEQLDAQTILSVAEHDGLFALECQLEDEIKAGRCGCQHGRTGEAQADDHAGCPHCGDDHIHAHNHHHEADEVFDVWGVETPKSFSKEEIQIALEALSEPIYGTVLRAKGILPFQGSEWWQFDFVPEEFEIRAMIPDYTGRLCVIGENLNLIALAKLFGV